MRTSSGKIDFVPPRSENTCAIVVTYNPDQKLPERIAIIRRQVSRVLIVDNASEERARLQLQALEAPDVELQFNHANLGIAAALNQGVERALALGLSWALTFDQDTWPSAEILDRLCAICSLQANPESVGMIGSNFKDENTGRLGYHCNDRSEFIEIKTVITSGTLMSLTAFSTAGSFRSEFFIDFVDHEYCLRLRRHGYKTLLACAPLTVHALGKASTLQLASREIVVLGNNPPARRYFMTRNGLAVVRENLLREPEWALRTLISLLFIALLKIPWEQEARGRKVAAMLLGAWHAMMGRFGVPSARWLWQEHAKAPLE